jgi:hypothetical protein
VRSGSIDRPATTKLGDRSAEQTRKTFGQTVKPAAARCVAALLASSHESGSHELEVGIRIEAVGGESKFVRDILPAAIDEPCFDQLREHRTPRDIYGDLCGFGFRQERVEVFAREDVLFTHVSLRLG